jgi:hypothetical protein
VLVDIQTILIHGPDLQFTTWDLLMFPENPTRGDDVRITVVVHNLGDEPVQSKEGATLILRDTEITWNTTTDKADYTDGVFLNETFYNISVPANGILFKDFIWRARPGGNVTVYAYIDANNRGIETPDNGGALEFNNLAFRTFRVLPKILLVDDDNITAGDHDSGAKLRQALIAAGASFDMYVTTGLEDPHYDSGSKQLKDYDIIIWTTGYEAKDTLTSTNLMNINRAMANGTYCWFVGQDMLADLSTQFGDQDGDPDPGEFAYDYIGVDNFTQPANGTPEILYGIINDQISNNLDLNLTDILAAEDRGVNISSFKNDSASDLITGFYYNSDELGPGGNATMRYYNVSSDFKTVYFGSDFSAINNAVIRAQVAYRVLRFLNWSLTFGTDFAVAEETFSKAQPQYLDRVWINATILNNGPEEKNVTVAFYVTGPDGTERLIAQYPDLKKNPDSVLIPGGGSKIQVSKQWLATDVGIHNFRVMVDPFDAFEEISEENNDITYSDLNTKLDVAFAILVVDDDNSTNNGGTYEDAVSNITKALDILNYDYDVAVVQGGTNQSAGPDVETLKHFNAVFWVTGYDQYHTLNDTDQEEIEKYLTGIYEEAAYIPNLRVNFMMLGTNLLEELNGSGTDITPSQFSFASRFLHVEKYSTNQVISDTLFGVTDHQVSHGLDYSLVLSGAGAPSDITTDVLVPTSDAAGIFWQDGYKTAYSGVSYNGTDYKMVFLPWAFSAIAPSNLSTETNQSELMFMLLNWFAYPEDRIELRTYSIDIDLNDDNPVIGNSYVVRTNVFNYGSTDTSAIVRYYDKNSIIDTQTIFLPGDGNSTSEIIWVPLFAGNRTLVVKVDAANDIPEIFEYINNNASRPNEEVFFFYDDMEMGTGNWVHESVLYRIRGESPLDYMDQPVYTNINGTWDAVDGFKDNYFDFHSSNSSFFATEPPGATGIADVLLALVIDDSRSMTERFNSDGDSWLDLAKIASKYLIAQISDDSKVSIWDFKGSAANHALSLTQLRGSGRTTVNDAIDNLINPAGHTVLWDATGSAYDEINGARAANPNLMPVVIVLSDGADYASADHSAVQSQKLEAASEDWCPWADMADGIQTYSDHQGKYGVPYDTIPGVWYTAGGGSFDKTRTGLLYSDIRIYTIGLGLEHHEPEDEPVTGTWPGNGVSDDNATYSGALESGTTEYNLWRVSTTSNATYYYSPTADDLNGIFGQIAKTISALLSRSDTTTRAMDIGAETKSALTGEFSLVGLDSAKLTFYHKYNLKLGYNGALMRIGTPNSTGGWAFRYIEPLQMYSSNLNIKRTEYDDFGTPMLWAWNGISGNGLFDWEYAEFDLSDFLGEPRVRLNFTLVLYGGGSGGGWWVDDVEIRVTRSNSNPVNINSRDQWEWTSTDAHSGTFSWWNHNATTNHISGGLDNSLITRSIDLTRARNATLTAYFKFNINSSSGRPPDGFRVEVTDDNGLTWRPINLGSRATWGVSGADSDASDGVPGDGKSYTGLDPDNDKWVEAGTLTRLDTDLSGWRGSVIKVRFRVVTTSEKGPFWSGSHYEDSGAGFGGIYVDDVKIYGESIEAINENVRSQASGLELHMQEIPMPYETGPPEDTFSSEEAGGEEAVAEKPEIFGPPAYDGNTLQDTEVTFPDSQRTGSLIEMETGNEEISEEIGSGLAGVLSSLGAVILVFIIIINLILVRTRRR